MARYSDAWIALVLLLVSGVFLSDLLSTEGSGAFVKTTTLPTALVVVLGILAILLLIKGFLAPKLAADDTGDSGGENVDRRGIGRLLALLAWVSLYVASLPWLGYMAASVPFLIGANLLFGNRRWWVILAWAVLLPLALLLFFEKVMIVLLPDPAFWG